MPANVETMFSVRETPWHGLGTIIEDAPTSKDAIRLAGLDWQVVQHDVVDAVTGTVMIGYKANVRNTDNAVLGMVTDRYKIVQNEEAFAFTDALLGEGVTYETAGSLASGKKVWMLARMEGRMITDEQYDPYLVFTNCHDGMGAIRVALTPIRVVCQNTLNLALENASRQWSCVHKGDIQGKLEEARMTLRNANAYLANLEEEFGEMKLLTLTDDEVKAYIDMLLPIDQKDADRRVRNIKELREELMARYLYAPDLQPIEKSAYRFVNAVSDFATHKEPGRKTINFRENRFIKTIDGNPMIDTAYRMMLELKTA